MSAETRRPAASPSLTIREARLTASSASVTVPRIRYAIESGRDAHSLQTEFCKKEGEPASYLQSERIYRSELDVFEHYDTDERDRLFGKPPATVCGIVSMRK